MVFMMISSGILVTELSQIHLVLEAQFGNDPFMIVELFGTS